MYITEAIGIAIKENKNVFHSTGFSYISFGILGSGHSIEVGPGPIHPQYLLTILGSIHTPFVLANDWQIIERKTSHARQNVTGI